MTHVSTAERADHEEVTSWPGVEAGHGRARRARASGSVVASSAICTASRVPHIGFPKDVWHELHDRRADRLPPGLPRPPGFGARALESDADVRDADRADPAQLRPRRRPARPSAAGGRLTVRSSPRAPPGAAPSREARHPGERLNPACTISCTAQRFPSGSAKKTNRPHGKSWTSVVSTPPVAEGVARRLGVGDDELEAVERARRHLREALADRDRAGGARRRQLDEPDLVADRVVVVEREARLLDVEPLGAVDVRDGDGDELELHLDGGACRHLASSL